MFPLVSILIPVYNRKDYIAECIQSVLDQTFTDFEVVIVDNASDDGTWDICQEYAYRDARIRIFRNEFNIGPVRNWKRCIDEAKGDFGKLLFSDDVIRPKFLEILLPYFENPAIGFAFSVVEIGDGLSQGSTAYQWRKDSSIVKSSIFIDSQFFGGNVPVSPGAALFRMKDLQKNLIMDIPSPMNLDFYGVGGGVDLLIYLLTANQYPFIAFSNENLCFFRNHQNSISIVYNKKNKLYEYYRQAKVHFSNTSVDRSMLDCLLLYFWYLDLKKSKKWVNINSVERKYLDGLPDKRNIFYIMKIGAILFYKKCYSFSSTLFF